MKRISHGGPRTRDHTLHIETPLGIVNIRTDMHDFQGRRVESISFVPNRYAGEPEVAVDGHMNTRLVEMHASDHYKVGDKVTYKPSGAPCTIKEVSEVGGHYVVYAYRRSDESWDARFWDLEKRDDA
jgi:hypothetical protein